MTVKEFCEKHEACRDGMKWGMEHGDTMQEIWDRPDIKPKWRIWVATRKGVLDDRTLRLFVCWCARQVWHMLEDERSRNAVEVAERFANGNATQEQLAAARAGAAEVAWAVGASENQSQWLIDNAKPKFE